MSSLQQILTENVSAIPAARRGLTQAACVFVLGVLSACQSVPVGQASFQRIELAARVPANGQLVLADLGGDSATDILLMSRQPGRLGWFENPGWQLHQISLVADSLHGVAAYSPPSRAAQNHTEPVPASLTLNGRFTQPGSGTNQQLIWLQNPGRALTQQAWPVLLIRSEVQAGALLWADMTGTGRHILVTLPGFDAFTLPQPLSRPWGGISLMQDSLPPARVRVFDWDLDGRDDLLIAGENGLDVVALASRGLFVDEITLLTAGSEPGLSASQQSSGGFIDVGVGLAGRPALRFIATLSANAQQLQVFRPSADENLPWVREIIADSLNSATVLQVSDLNRDTFDEIVVGDADGLSVFYYVAEQQSWRRYSVDNSVGISDIQILDLTGNGFPDIVTAPAETGPVMLFQNRGI